MYLFDHLATEGRRGLTVYMFGGKSYTLVEDPEFPDFRFWVKVPDSHNM